MYKLFLRRLTAQVEGKTGKKPLITAADNDTIRKLWEKGYTIHGVIAYMGYYE